MKPKYTELHKGVLFVDCSECKHGGNGDSSCNPETKGNKGNCTTGALLDKFEIDKVKVTQ